MEITLKHSRYQAGSLTTESRTNGADVYVYRWRQSDRDGRTKQRKIILGTIKELTKASAKKKADEYRTLINAPEKEDYDNNLTFAELVGHYTERELQENSGRAEKPRKAYLYIFNNYLLPRWGSLPLRAVKAVVVEDWLKTLSLANGSKAKIREVFGAAFRHAMRYEMYPSNPITHVRQTRKRASEPEILEPAEIAAVLRELEGIEPIRTAFLIAAVMGMRRGEIFGLKWADINFERALLHVRRSYVDGVVGPPKTESSRRALPIPQQAMEALQVWRAKSSFCQPDDWIFASEISFGKQPYWPATLWRRNVVPAIERAGITKSNLGWHTLRRTYASLLLSSGISLRVSMELMRHSTPEMTLGLYAQTVGDEKRDAGRMVASLVMGDSTQK
jgi:integrase